MDTLFCSVGQLLYRGWQLVENLLDAHQEKLA